MFSVVLALGPGRGHGPWWYLLTGCRRIDPSQGDGLTEAVKNVNLLRISGIFAKKGNVMLFP